MGPYHCLRGRTSLSVRLPWNKAGIQRRSQGSAGGLEERISSKAGVTCETGPARHVLGVDAGRRHEAERTRPVPSQSSVRPVRDAIGCRLALAFRPGSYRVPGGVKERSWQVPVHDPAARLRFGPVRLRGRFGVPFPPGPEILFPVAIDWVLGKQQEKRGVKWVPETKFADLDFADDLAENARDLQPLVTNIGHTLLFNRSVTIDENKLKVVENFTYLGSSTNNKGQMDNELDCRLGKASAAFNQLDFETYYVEISQEKRLESLDVSDSECVRKILSIRRQDVIPNTDI
ncbi:hypothetical protein Bbelb_026820 [Branchiostoma belcheri]|nr:hypothetical protein Bbelb_026820 [Branchiostoma belcheri]